MKRWSRRPEKRVPGRKWDPRFAEQIELIVKVCSAIEHRVVLHRIMAEAGQLTLVSLVVAAEHKRLTRIVMSAVGR